MGLLDKLWDDTLAGPRPETGLGRLRKHASFSLPLSPGKDAIVTAGIARTFSDDLPEEVPRVTRSIMIRRPAGCPSPVSGTPPASPMGSTSPLSPCSGMIGAGIYLLTKTISALPLLTVDCSPPGDPDLALAGLSGITVLFLFNRNIIYSSEWINQFNPLQKPLNRRVLKP